MRALIGSPSGVAALVALSLFAVAAVLGPSLVGDAIRDFDVTRASQGPSSSHPLGTDTLGRDVLARTVVATRLSLELALAATGIAVAIGFSFGVLLAMLPARPRAIGLRLVDVALGFPAILLAIFVTAILGVGQRSVVLGVGIAFAPSLARFAYTLAASVTGREYIAAARILGVPPPRLFFRYLLPNIAEPLIVTTSFVIGSSLIAVSSLSFLGLGVQPPDFDWGRMLTDGIETFSINPAEALVPASTIAFAGVAFGLIGEALARSTNPRLWTGSGAEVGGR